MKPSGKTAVFGGQARLPKDLSTGDVFQVITEVNVETGEVLDADFSPCPPLIARILKKKMVGMSLPDDTNELLNKLENDLFYKGKKAVITAIKDLAREFREYRYRVSKNTHPSSEG